MHHWDWSHASQWCDRLASPIQGLSSATMFSVPIASALVGVAMPSEGTITVLIAGTVYLCGQLMKIATDAYARKAAVDETSAVGRLEKSEAKNKDLAAENVQLRADKEALYGSLLLERQRTDQVSLQNAMLQDRNYELTIRVADIAGQGVANNRALARRIPLALNPAAPVQVVPAPDSPPFPVTPAEPEAAGDDDAPHPRDSP